MERDGLKVSMPLHPTPLKYYWCLKGKTVTLKMKTSDFNVKSRGVTLPRLIFKDEELFQAASSLLQQEVKCVGPAPLKLRLIGNYNACPPCLNVNLFAQCRC